MENFIKKITGDGKLKMEYNYQCNSATKESSYEEILKKNPKKENLFFCSGIKDINSNRNAKNIEYVNKVTLDLDIRKEVKEHFGAECTNEDIIHTGKELASFLKEEKPNDFGQWGAIVFTGNGLQIHYFGQPQKVEGELFAEHFREAMIYIYNEFYEYMGNPYKPDGKVGDLGHLFRLPETWNVKEGKRNKSIIVAEQDVESDFVNKLPLLLKAAKNRIEERNKAFEAKKKVTTKTLNQEEDVFEKIRKSVDVGEIMQYFVPERPIKKDNKNFSKKGKAGNNSYFIDRENNIIIRNGSTFLAGTKEGMNPIDLVEEYTGLNGKELLQWFVDKKFISINK